MEIERKYLVNYLPPNLDNYPYKHIAQGYLNTNPVLRIRKSNHNYFFTYKGLGLLAREEHEFPLSQEAFEHLIPKIDGILIEKKRYLIPLDKNLTAELDIFQGKLAPLCLVEVEFSSEEQANAFLPPDWFGEDVTYSGKYHNSNLSQQPI